MKNMRYRPPDVPTKILNALPNNMLNLHGIQDFLLNHETAFREFDSVWNIAEDVYLERVAIRRSSFMVKTSV